MAVSDETFEKLIDTLAQKQEGEEEIREKNEELQEQHQKLLEKIEKNTSPKTDLEKEESISRMVSRTQEPKRIQEAAAKTKLPSANLIEKLALAFPVILASAKTIETQLKKAGQLLNPLIVRLSQLTAAAKNIQLDKVLAGLATKLATFKIPTSVTTSFKGFARLIQSASSSLAPLGRALQGIGVGLTALFPRTVMLAKGLGKLATPLILVTELFDAAKLTVGDFRQNAAQLSEAISERGVIGRAWYGLTHMTNTLAAATGELIQIYESADGVLAEMFGSTASSIQKLRTNIEVAAENIVTPIVKYTEKLKTKVMDDLVEAVRIFRNGTEDLFLLIRNNPVFKKFFGADKPTGMSAAESKSILRANVAKRKDQLLGQLEKFGKDQSKFQNKSLDELEKVVRELKGIKSTPLVIPKAPAEFSFERLALPEAEKTRRAIETQNRLLSNILDEMREGNTINNQILKKPTPEMGPQTQSILSEFATPGANTFRSNNR